MSARELAKSLIDQVPENKLLYIIAYLQGAAILDESETPNTDTLEAWTTAVVIPTTGRLKI